MAYTQHSEDQDLIGGCLRGNRSAQQQLYRRYYGKLLGIGMRYTGQQQEANDILNRSFLKIFQKLDQYQPTGSLQSWMATIVFNTAIDYVRSQTKYRDVMDFNAEKEKVLAPEIIDQLFAEDLFKAIQRLPVHSRTVFSLYVVDGYKHREIAELLQINQNTSKYHLAKARKQLQVALKNYNPNQVKI